MRHVISFAFVAAVTAITTTANAATLKVPSATYPTIASAIAAATFADVVLIKAGTYTETIDISNALGLTLIGQGKVVLDATGNTNGIVGTNVSFSWLENLTVRNSTGRGIELTGVTASLLRKLRVENAGNDGIKLASSTAVQLVSCTTKGCGDDGFDLFTSSSVISKCVARTSQTVGIRVDGSYNSVGSCTVESAASIGLSLGFDATSAKNAITGLRVKGLTGTGVSLGSLGGNNAFFDIIVSSCAANGFETSQNASNNSIRKVSVSSTGAAGFVVRSSNNVIDACTTSKATTEGFSVDANASFNLIVNCSAVSCATGFSLAGGTNTVMRSKTSKCALTVTEVGNPQNVYVDNNFPDPDSF